MNYIGHFNFTPKNTPLQSVKIKHTSNRIFVKRDDLTGIELSGNKVRKLDFLLKDAVQQGAKRIITCGGLQSNHCRTTAFMAAKLGLKTTLVLKGHPPPKVTTGNYLLSKLVDADIKIITEEEYRQVDEIMEGLAGKYSEKSYIIPEGGSNALGAWGYVKAFEEMVNQLPDVDVIVIPTGSGGTHAGLLLGKWLTGHACQIVSVNVCDSAAFFKKKIASILSDFRDRFVPHLEIKEDEIEIVDGFVGPGYGKATARETEVIKRVARNYGFVLDPVYTAKAWLGFENLLEQDRWSSKKIIFVHTGGIFGLFAYGHLF